MVEFLLIVFVLMVAFSSIKLIVQILWSIMAPLSTLGAAVIVMYLFSLLSHH